jgi:hypothetical protein
MATLEEILDAEFRRRGYGPGPDPGDGNGAHEFSGVDLTLPTLTSAEFLALDFPSSTWLLGQLVPAACLFSIIGKPKVGKTAFFLALAFAVARGVPFLDRPVRRGRVLFLALEGNLQDLQVRFKRLGGFADDDIHWFIERPVPDLILVRLARAIADLKPVLTVIDVLGKLLGEVEDLNKAYITIDTVLGPLQALADEHHCAIALVHHSGKETREDPFDAGIGSTRLRGSVDASLALRRRPATGERTIVTELRPVDGVNIPERILVMDATTGWLTLGDAIDEAARKDIRADVLSFVRSRLPGGATRKEVRDGLDHKFTEVVKTIDQFLAEGLLREVFRGEPDSRGRVQRKAKLVPGDANVSDEEVAL